MQKVNWPNNIRVDGPDLRAVLDLVAAHFDAQSAPLYGIDLNVGQCGVVDGMTILVDVGLPSPLENAIITGGVFLDAARKFIKHSGTTSLDISGVAGTNGAKVWARVAATQLETTQEDRVLIAAGVETTQPSYTRLVDQLEWTATTGATPAGTGWALVLTVDTWVLFSGVNVPQNVTRNLMWFGYGWLHLYASQIRDEIAEIKGVSAPNWTNAPAQNLTQLASRVTTVENQINNALQKGAAKAAAWVQQIAGVCSLVGGKPVWNVASVTYVSPGVYDVNITGGLVIPQANVLEQSQVSSTGSTTAGWDFLCTYTYAGGYLTKVRVEAFDESGNAAEADAFRILIV